MQLQTEIDVINHNVLGFVGIQFNFYQSINHYVEKRVYYDAQPVLYYQFQTSEDKANIPIIPDGCIDFLFCCDLNKPKAFICGSVLQETDTPLIPFETNTIYFGVRLSSRLSIDIPNVLFKETVNTMVPLQDIFPQYKEWASMGYIQGDFLDKIHYFEQCCAPLLYGGREASLLDQCLDEITKSMGLISVQQLASLTGYSTRYIRNRFDDKLGLSPKYFAQIIRFQQTLNCMLRQQSLADVTFNMGYFDQAHLSKNFKHFSNMTPMQMMRQLSYLSK